MDILSGSIERITYYNPENGYSVVRLRPDRQLSTPVRGASNREGLVTLTGNLPELSPGEYVRLRGSWSMHAKHGMQFQVEYCEQALPATVSGIKRYLGSGLIKGIGPKLADRIVAMFGAQTLDVIEQHPGRLAEVADIGPKRSRSIAKAWEEQKQVKEIMLFLHSHGVSTNLAVKIYKTYGDESLQIVQADPYRLARDIYGIGFKTADRIARALGLPPDHPSRIEAGVVYVLNEMTGEGHVFAPQPVLIQLAAELLEVEAGLIVPAIERLSADERVRIDRLPLQVQAPEIRAKQAAQSLQAIKESPAVYDQPAVYLTPIFYGEVGVAERLRVLASSKTLSGPVEKVILSRSSEAIQALGDLSLSEEQQKAIKIALTRPVSVLTGGPGTGKTTALKALIASLEALRKSYALASPTGRAAKRLSEATGRPASTIHRLLGFSPGEGFEYNAQNPLPVDMLVVDEASMLDLLLANNLVKALRPGTHLLLVGDVDQLPSVGAGDVLRDVIASELAPVTCLNTIFRQAAGSQIITNAHRINQGQMPVFSSPASSEVGGAEGDFFLFPAETAEEAAKWVVEVVTDRIPRRFKLHPRDDVQVLSPMYRGPAGVHALNESLQAELNPPDSHKPEKALFGTLFRVGDKVMQTQNNYDKEVYNGDIGRVTGLDLIEHSLSVDFEGKEVTYDFVETDQLVLAYAVSVHKAQGSEFPAVVMPLVTGHYMMLQRNLLYTAITRAKRLCVLSGSRKAIAMAVKNNKVAHRYTALDWRLRSGIT